MIRYLAVIPLVLIPGLLLGGFAQANDQLGIYWDAEFTQDSISTDTFPSIHTGYLVLMDPTSVLGVSKWECCVGIEGPAIFISWVLAGQALNLETPPCFWVSISSDPLPAGGPVLLATFMTMVTEELPVSLSVVPLANPTLPDRMSFTSADDPANPLPMFSVTGNPEVAWVNKHVPLLEIDREHVIFHDTIVGYPKTEIITVTNLGFVDVDLTAAFSDTSGVYALSSPGNPATIPARSVVDLEITFAPSGSGYFSSYLDLGGLLPEVLLAGNGLGGNLSWEMDPVLDFGGVEIDRFKWGYLTIINTGEVPFPVDPSLPGGISCSAFEFTFGPAPTTLGPADTLTIQLTFSPPADRPYSCALALGEVLPDVTLQGVGFVDVLDWIAPTTMTLGPVGIGSSVEQTIQIQNTGTIPFSVDPTFPVPCAEFFIEQGAGEIDLAPGANLNVRVKFEPASIGSSICTLDLGEVVPPVTLTGLGRDPVLIWDCPAQLDIGEVALGEYATSFFYVWNVGDLPFSIDVVLPGTCPEFEITQGEGLHVLDPGRSHRVNIRFTPSALDSATCAVGMGDVVAPVLLTGVGVEPDPGWTIYTPVFPTTGVGEIYKSWVRVSNTGNSSFRVVPYLDSPCNHFVIRKGSFTSQPGDTDFIWMDFHPTAPGSLSCVLNLGSVLPEVTLVGEASPRPEGWEITPPVIEFPLTFVGDSRYTDVEFHNTGGTTLTIEARLDPEIPNLTITSNGGPFDVLPGYDHSFRVLYQPVIAGADSSTFQLGAAYSPIPISGLAEDKVFSCQVQPDTLDFGLQMLGETASLPYSITNTGNQLLEVAPLLDSEHFSLVYREESLDPGRTFNGLVTYLPHSIGYHETPLDLGNALCQEIICQGTGQVDSQDGENLVGIFFDPGFSTLSIETTASPEIVTGYLVLINPSTPTGVGAWECSYDLVGTGQYLGWQFEGQAINVGDYNNLIVGIGGPPLPFGPQVLLATFQLLVPGPTSILELSLGPVQFPSIAGQMVWAPGDPPGILLPMLPFTGQETVAWVNKDVSLVESEIPLATALMPNIPNPFNPSTRINFGLAQSANVRVVIYDVTGRAIMTLVDEFLEAGAHSQIWLGRDDSGRQAPSGPYFVRMVTGKRVDTQKILLLK